MNIHYLSNSINQMNDSGQFYGVLTFHRDRTKRTILQGMNSNPTPNPNYLNWVVFWSVWSLINAGTPICPGQQTCLDNPPHVGDGNLPHLSLQTKKRPSMPFTLRIWLVIWGILPPSDCLAYTSRRPCLDSSHLGS